MARGRGRGKRKASKHKADADDEPPAKLQREESTNTQLRRAINEAKESASEISKPKRYKSDFVLLQQYPKAGVYEDYACMLNQTNIGNNNNKFYIIQVNQDAKNYICFTRWGRVGEVGQSSCDIQKDAEGAIKSFKKKFKDKTKNDWDKRENFTPQAGKYTLIEIDDDDDDDGGTDTVDTGNLKKELVPFKGPSTLVYRTEIMIKLIFSDDMFINQMSSMKLDVRKMPLGKLSKVQIAKGLETLIDIEEAIKNNKPRKVLMDLSSKFYTLVPHDFGRMTPPVLESSQIVQDKKEVMLTLSDIELTQSLQKEKANKTIHPLLEKYEMLECVLELLDKSNEEFKLIQHYASSCTHFRKEQLLDVWRVDRKGEQERFSAHNSIKHRKLLWHGTKVAVVAAILKAGLRIMPHSGGRVGRGIYFASEYSKSSGYVGCNYGTFEGEEMVGFIFLVEVALGKEKNIAQDASSLTKAPDGYDSVVARGRNEPDPDKDKKLNIQGKEVIVPVGEPVPQKDWSNSHFYQSEYLVYKESQARIRYMLKISFK